VNFGVRQFFGHVADEFVAGSTSEVGLDSPWRFRSKPVETIIAPPSTTVYRAGAALSRNGGDGSPFISTAYEPAKIANIRKL
jgi:hypothetical protein